MASLLEQLSDLDIKQDAPLDKYAFAQVGGKADFLAFPNNVEEFQRLLKTAYDEHVHVTVLGQLSNMLVSDDGVEGLVIITQHLNKIHIEGNDLISQPGRDMISVSEYAYEHGLQGLEWAAGLPGSVGGAVYMNAGAYGGNTADNLKRVKALDIQGNIVQIEKEDLGFTYRMSAIQKENFFVVEATFEMQPGDKKEIRGWMDDFNQRRISKQPLNLPSNGSVFKRPTGHYAGKLIADCGLQGTQIGGAQLSPKHANFIVNVDNAKAQDYVELIKLVKKTIKEKFKVDMELEIRMIGRNFN